MRERYLAIALPVGARERLEPRLTQIATTLERRFGMVRVFDADRLVVHATRGNADPSRPGWGGLVIGALFHRGGEADRVQAAILFLGPPE